MWVVRVVEFMCVSAMALAVADANPKRFRQLGWLWFVTVQLIMLAFTILGWVLLIPFCLTHAWEKHIAVSIADSKRMIDVWDWHLLNYIYANPEDGVSGKYALVWVNGVLGPYLPNAPAWWRAYLWSAWRNSCDALKYRFSWENGPQAEWRGHKLGWWPENGYKVPLL